MEQIRHMIDRWYTITLFLVKCIACYLGLHIPLFYKAYYYNTEGSTLRPDRLTGPPWFPPRPDEFDTMIIDLDSGMSFEIYKSQEWKPLDRPTLIFYHGFPDNKYSFLDQMIHFQDQFNVLSAPLRGYEPSYIPPDNDFKVSSMAIDVNILMDKTGLLDERAQVHLIGHNWGGEVIKEVAR